MQIGCRKRSPSGCWSPRSSRSWPWSSRPGRCAASSRARACATRARSSRPGRSRRPARSEPLAPSLPDGGPNGAAIWVHGGRSPAAAVALLRAAGIPARVVRRSPRPPAPARAELAGDEPQPRGRARVLAYVHHGGTFLAVAPSRPCAPASAPRASPSSPASCRCRSAASRAAGICATARSRRCGASGRRHPAASGSATPRAGALGLVLLHDVRGLEALRAAPALVRREHATGVRATYVVQTRYLTDARGAPLVGPALAGLVHAIGTGSGDVVAGGVAGGPLARRRGGTAARPIRPTPPRSHPPRRSTARR